jgi:hypothetical protein
VSARSLYYSFTLCHFATRVRPRKRLTQVIEVSRQLSVPCALRERALADQLVGLVEQIVFKVVLEQEVDERRLQVRVVSKGGRSVCLEEERSEGGRGRRRELGCGEVEIEVDLGRERVERSAGESLEVGDGRVGKGIGLNGRRRTEVV